jgi:hypothetical protein
VAAGGWASSEALVRYLETDGEMIRAAIQQPTANLGQS